MTGAQLSLSLFDAITVNPTREVLYSGANARSNGQPLFTHRHVPDRPSTVHDEQGWIAMLDLAEDARRYNQASLAVLNLDARDRAGSNGPIGTGTLMLDSNGCRCSERGGRASWAQLLAGRREQRHAEPEIAAARDLAEAYHYLDYYGRVYERQVAPSRSGWRADRFIAKLARQVLDLGGELTLIEPHTDYMRAGLREVASGS
jgi:hypothetical protein